MGNKTFCEQIEKKVRQTIKKYTLLKKNERCAVAVSGGKDSVSCLHILNKLGYRVEALLIDHGIGEYAKTNAANVENNCKILDIPFRKLSFKEEFGKSLRKIRETLLKNGYSYSYCMICGILKRYLMNKAAREFEYDVIATGHNLDDEAQAFVMNVFRNDFKLGARQGPAPGIIDNNKFVRRIKPLFFVSESDLKKYAKTIKLHVNYSQCPYTKSSYRHDFKEMLNNFEKRNPSIKYNILHFQQTMKGYIELSKIPEIGLCEKCGEPSSAKVCKACEIVEKII
ncbi:MAG: TIGR00269 family protein [Candidatus Nanoarchaeia archaeon]